MLFSRNFKQVDYTFPLVDKRNIMSCVTNDKNRPLEFAQGRQALLCIYILLVFLVEFW